MAELSEAGNEFARCSRVTTFCCNMLSHCRTQGARLRRKQDIGWARGCADDCLGVDGQMAGEGGSTIGPKLVYTLRRPSVTACHKTRERLA